MRKRHILAVSAIVVAAGLVFTGCSSSNNGSSGGETSNKVLTVGMPNGPQQPNQNPLATGSASLSLGYAFAVYESLMQVNEIKPTDPPTPWLAESVEPNEDATEWTIVTKEGISFHDGVPFDADAVVANIEARLQSPLTSRSNEPIESVEKIDDTTVVVHMKRP